MVSNKRQHMLPSPPDSVMAAVTAGPSAAQAPLQVAWRRRWTILLAVLLCLGGGLVYLMKATPQYTSTSRIYVEQPPRLLGEAQGMAPQSGSYLYTQAERIKSTNNLAAAVEATDARNMKTFRETDNIIAYLKRELQVRVGRQDELISVSFTSPYREEAALLVNGIVDAFVSSQAAKKKSSAGEILGILQNWKQQNDAELKQKMQELVAFKQANGTLSFAGAEGKGNIVLERLAKLSEALTTAQLATFEAEAEYEAAKEKLNDPASRTRLVEAVQSQGVDRMDKEYSELLAELRTAQTELLSLRQRGIIRNSAVDDLLARVAFVKEQIAERETVLAEGYVASLDQKRQAARAKEQDIRATFAEQEKEALALNSKSADLVRLEAEVQRAEQLNADLAKRIKEVGVDATADTAALNISVEEVARPEDKPTSPNRPRTMALALVMGMMLGLAGAFAREWTDHRLRSADEVAATLGLPVLGVVPQMVGKHSIIERGQSVRLQPMSETAEAYRTIRTAVFFGAPGEDMKTILVTSPAPGDGKTTSASNLAIALAQAGHRTLLVDCDFRKPSQHKVFDIDATVGLSNVISGQIKLREAVRQTETPGLYVLPCGAIPPNPSEILNGKRFAQVMEVLCNAFDRIVLDSPPVMPVTDARILAASADLTILVLRAEKSTERMSRHARDGLLSVGANILGVVVNGMSKKKREGYYGYGYGGYYGRGDGKNPPAGAELVDAEETGLPTRAIELRPAPSRARDE
jgi:capsular exopolysaccharide synthesis family protein